ncbi:MAG: S9 family peptidase [Acidimicrobiia bacterium]
MAPARPHVLRHDGDERIDPWFWLGQRNDPEVLAHLRAENEHTAAATAHLAGLRSAIYDEIVGRVQETDASSPTPFGPHEYFTRTIEGHQYAVHCRRPRVGSHVLPDPLAAPGASAGEVVVVDENDLAGDDDYFSVGDLVLSPSQRIVALSTDTTGGERHTLRFRAIPDAHGEPGAMLDDVVPDVYYGVAWADDTTVLYTRPDDAMRPWQVWRHTLGTPATSDALVFQEDDDRFYVSVGRTRTGRYLVITTASKVTSEVWLVPTADPAAAPVVVEPRAQGHEYHVEHHDGPAGDRLFVLSNAPTPGDGGADNFALLVTPTATPGRANWQQVLPARTDVRLDDVDAFARHLVVSERGGGLERLRVLRLAADGGIADDHVVAMPDAVYSVWTGSNLGYDTDILRYQYTSLVAPTSAYDFDVTTQQSTLVKRQPVPGYDPSRYESRRLWATAPDGTQVPISVVWNREVRGDGASGGGPGALLLYGYGSYEVSIDPTFSVGRVSLLDRGVAFAIAHIRGGGEMGRAWYDDGKLLHKRNTFTDFVACADHLVAEGWTTPDQLAIRGGSAGGLLMGAVTNLRPELFRVVVAEVPFVDCLTTILDESLPLTVTEWEEWGDPLHDPAVYAYMKSYSPYDNVVALPGAAAYPAMLVTGGLNDPRVQYWEPAKWVAKLRSVRTDDRALLLKMEMGAGHSGPSGRYEAWRDEAFVLSFVLDQLGLAPT